MMLKRSASTASLPTPPRTQRRRRSRPGESSSDEDMNLSGDNGRKRRRMDNGDEDEFWLSKASSSAKTLSTDAGATSSDDTEERDDVPLLFRVDRQKSSQGLASPPPSHRKKRRTVPRMALDFAPSLDALPETPKQESGIAIRDSPNNPFLASPMDEADDGETVEDDLEEEVGEPKMLTYVHRGKRIAVPNPNYDPSKPLHARSPPPESRLPMDHPDYVPDLRCPPKALFRDPSQPRRRPKAKKTTKPKILDPFDSSDDERDSKKQPVDKLLMAPGAGGIMRVVGVGSP